jgi:hypothetical protein
MRRVAPHHRQGEAAVPYCRFARIGASHMMDILMLGLGLGLFAAGIGYAYACERL